MAEANYFELARANWFWLRKPKATFYESGTALIFEGLCVLLFWTIAFIDWPLTSLSHLATEAIILLFGAAIGIGATVHRIRFVRWRREYELSVARLIRMSHPAL